MDQEQATHLHRAQVDSLYQHTHTLALGHPIAGALLLWQFWHQLPGLFIVAWVLCSLLLAGLRHFSYVRYQKSGKDAAQLNRWEWSFILFSATQGFIYFFVWLILVDASNPATNATVGLWIVGLSACSVVGYSANLRGLFGFFIPAVIPGMAVLIWEGSRFSWGLSLALLLYVAIVSRTFMPVNRSIKQSIILNFQLEKEIENRKKVESQLRAMSKLDGLTGLANRRHFDEVLEQELQRSARNEMPLALCLIDIDFFKAYNDTYGHLEGDVCLKTLSKLLQDSVHRSGELAARFGGEEFALIMPNTTAEQAEKLVNSLRNQLLELQIPHSQTGLQELGCVTFSAGIASLVPNLPVKVEPIIRLADNALYDAKAQGRNRVVVSTQEAQVDRPV